MTADPIVEFMINLRLALLMLTTVASFAFFRILLIKSQFIGRIDLDDRQWNDVVTTVALPRKKVTLKKQLYPMTRMPRGYAVIVNNVDFKNPRHKRIGSDKDAVMFGDLFFGLGFDVKTRRNLTRNGTKQWMKNLTKDKKLVTHDALVVVVMSHGDFDFIYDHDYNKLCTLSLAKRFNDANCPALAGKPKIFIYIACRGDRYNYGVDSLCNDHVSNFEEPPSTSNCCKPGVERDLKDTVICRSTPFGYNSIRTPDGTPFCKAFCRALATDAHRCSLKQLLRKVVANVKKMNLKLAIKVAPSNTYYQFDDLYF